MRAILKDVLGQVQNYETYYKIRERARSAADQATFEATVEAIICDLACRHTELPGGQVHLSQSNQVLRKKSRYKGVAMGKTLPDILKVMKAPEMDFVVVLPGLRDFKVQDDGLGSVFSGRQTRLSAGPRLVSRLEKFAITQADIKRDPNEEVLHLRAKKVRDDRSGALIDYTDTEDTQKMRSDLRAINAALANADISCLLEEVDTQYRRLLRIFNNGDFDQGGRLYGGFWQAMTSSDRLENILIDDEEVVELDFGQMGLMLLYALEGETPPAGDLYDLTEFGIPASARPGIKKVVQSAINASKPLKRMPKGARKTIPSSISLARVMSAIRAKHGAVAQKFYGGVGMQLMRLESDILVEVLLAANREGIVALPVHDAVLVRTSHQDRAVEIMIKVFQDHTGLTPEVSVESS